MTSSPASSRTCAAWLTSAPLRKGRCPRPRPRPRPRPQGETDLSSGHQIRSTARKGRWPRPRPRPRRTCRPCVCLRSTRAAGRRAGGEARGRRRCLLGTWQWCPQGRARGGWGGVKETVLGHRLPSWEMKRNGRSLTPSCTGKRKRPARDVRPLSSAAPSRCYRRTRTTASRPAIFAK